MATELELKFQVPAQRLAALRRAVATRGAEVQPLAAAYVDAPGDLLARARMALRVRSEGGQWVQTLKAEDGPSLRRLEHNVALGPALAGGGDTPPLVDPARHAGTPAGEALARLLAAAGAPRLEVRYATDVQRTLRQVRHQGAVVELALDQGWLRAGAWQVPVCELEMELLSGPVSALLDLAERWVQRHGLVLDVRSKSERGQLLAAHALAHPVPPPGPAVEPALMSPPTVLRPGVLRRDQAAHEAGAWLRAQALRQALGNASQVLSGHWTPEHLRQLRAGLRRLQAVLVVLGEALGPVPDDLPGALAGLSGALGAWRDQDVARQTWLPALQAAGAPWWPGQGAPGASADSACPPPEAVLALLRAPATQQLWLRCLALSLPSAAPAHGPAPRSPAAAGDAAQRAQAARSAPPGPRRQADPDDLVDLLKPRLRALLRQVRADAARAEALDEAQRHRLRRRLRRLRFAVEATTGLWPVKRQARCLDTLLPALAALGDWHDSQVALDRCRAQVVQQPEAWFAVGWLSARVAAQWQASVAALAPVAGLRGPWARRKPGR